MNKTLTVSEGAEVDMAALDDLLGDLEIEEIEAAGVEEDVVVDEVEASEEDVAAAISEIELDDARADAYSEMEATADAAPEAVAEAAEAKPVKAKAEKKAKSTKAPSPRVRIDVKDLGAESFVLTTAIPEDLDANKAAVLARRPAQKKVAEKFDNLLITVAAGKPPSTYTLDCYRVLKAKGEATTAELVAMLTSTSKKIDKSAVYSIGTARSQAGQIMSLFPALQIAKREGSKLTLNPDSTLAVALDGMI